MEEPPSVFKKSTDLGYCIRNRFLARSPDYKITYFIPHDSVHPENGQVSFAIQSILELNPFLKATIGLYSNYALHITIDEQNPIHPRYKIPREDILNSDILPLQVIPRVTESSITWEIAGYKYILHLSPILIQGYYKGDLIISVNQNSLLNFERYRNESDIIGHSGYDLIDTTGLPGNTNQWEEEFNGNVEVIPKGPSSIGVDVVFHNTSAVYGIPEHSNEVSLKDTMDSEPYRLYNSDVFLYKLDRTDGLYGSIPFMVSKHAGVFWVNSSDTSIDIRTSGNDKITHWYSETGVLELMLFLSSSPIDLISTFTVMTGPAALPPLFSLGYHQCRWNYYSQKEVLEINSKFDYYDIPLDVIWLDIEHTDKKKYFTWDSEAFPEPIKMQDILALNGRKLVNIIDPHILIDPNYEVYNFFNSNSKFK
jgi:mannosyl-oligosaccharide alpha-1,3-glucosidase